MTADPRYPHVLRAIYGRPWAILPGVLAMIVDLARFRASGGSLSDDEIRARLAAAADTNGPRAGGQTSAAVAIIPIYGPISQRQSMMADTSGGTSTEQILSDYRSALADAGVDGIVFDIDSPGGTVDGIQELADEIRAGRGTKPVVAVANVMAASAAYWIASSADEIVVTPSGYVGSIGVFAAHTDLSKAAEMDGVKTTLVSAGKYKTEGNPWEPLGEEAKAAIQDQVDQVYATFTASVARSRGVPVDTVRKGYGEGRVLLAKQALSAGMVDRIDTLENTIRRVARTAVTGARQPTAAAFRADVVPSDPCPECRHAADCTCTTCACGNDMHTNMAAAALGSGLSYGAQLALVSAGAEELVRHARARVDMRAQEGRRLSTTDRTALLGVADSLRALATDPDPEPDPVPEPVPPAAWALQARVRLALARAEFGIE